MIGHWPATPSSQAAEARLTTNQARTCCLAAINHLVAIDRNDLADCFDDTFADKRRLTPKFIEVIPRGVHVFMQIKCELEASASHNPFDQFRLRTITRVAELAIDVTALSVAPLIPLPAIRIDARQNKPVHAPSRPFTALQPSERSFHAAGFLSVNSRSDQNIRCASRHNTLDCVPWVARDSADATTPPTPRRQCGQSLRDMTVVSAGRAHVRQLTRRSSP